jgi:hypothetical protein
MEKNIDCMKYRKSTHLAGVDVETIVAEKGNCILTIKDAFYDTGVDVSGNKTDGYFITFVEAVKPMVVNSVNRKTIADIIKIEQKRTSTESRNIGNWVGLKIELIFNADVKMMGKVTGGIRIAPKSPIPTISDANGIKVLNECKTLAELPSYWSKLSKNEQSLPTVNALKDKLKTTLK